MDWEDKLIVLAALGAALKSMPNVTLLACLGYIMGEYR